MKNSLSKKLLLGLIFTSASINAAESLKIHSQKFLENNCMQCHDEFEAKGGLRFDIPLDQAKYQKIFSAVQGGYMPPAREDQPSAADKKALLQAIAGKYSQVHQTQGSHLKNRLSKDEYLNSLEDFFGQRVPLEIREMIADDNLGHGFDVSSELGLSVDHLSRYYDASHKLVEYSSHCSHKTSKPSTARASSASKIKKHLARSAYR